VKPLQLAIDLIRELSGVVGGDAYTGALYDGRACSHRLLLWRVWDDDAPVLVWWMLNPSTADHESNDPTIRRCIAWARMWGFGGIVVVNCYALRSTSPAAMLRHADRIGVHNDDVLRAVIDRAAQQQLAPDRPRIVVAWGEHLELERESAITALLLELQIGTHCLGRTKAGRPRHPVRLPYDTPLEHWP
jgi:hypothetical protein